MEDWGFLDPANNVDIFCLHFVAFPLLDGVVQRARNTWNHHKIRTEKNQTPHQLWISGLVMLAQSEQSRGQVHQAWSNRFFFNFFKSYCYLENSLFCNMERRLKLLVVYIQFCMLHDVILFYFLGCCRWCNGQFCGRRLFCIQHPSRTSSGFAKPIEFSGLWTIDYSHWSFTSRFAQFCRFLLSCSTFF